MMNPRTHLWRGLEELANSPELRARIENEFPEGTLESPDPLTRRQFLTLLGASLGLAGLSGCTRPPPELILPYVRQPEGRVPGKSLYYATAMPLAGHAIGLLAESYEGRPIKVEGNPAHPDSRGATDAFAQASVLTLYDPQRSQTTLFSGRPRSFGDLTHQLSEVVRRHPRGQGLSILTETVGSPSLAGQLRVLRERLPDTRWYSHDPGATRSAVDASRSIFDAAVGTHYDLTRADVVLALDAGFLCSGPGHLRYAHDFMQRRKGALAPEKMNRLYVVEPMPTGTGTRADHRLPLRARDVVRFARDLAGALGVAGLSASAPDVAYARWLTALADDLRFVALGKARVPGTTLVIAGDRQPPEVHALAQAINYKLGNFGTTVLHTTPAEEAHGASLAELAQDMHAGKVSTLLVLESNPVYTAPPDLEVAAGMRKVPLCIHLGLYRDETADLCHWHVPAAHYLESWGDARAYEGTASVIQPLIAPLYGGKTSLELLAALLGQAGRSAYDVVRDTWRDAYGRRASTPDFEAFWRSALHDGVVEGTAFSRAEVQLRKDWAKRAGLDGKPTAADGTEIVFRLDPTIFDGRFAGNGWLQELPKPMTKLTWDNAAMMSPATAQTLGMRPNTFGDRGGEHGEGIAEVVELHHAGRRVQAPVWIVPGHADGSITVHLGYGRTRAGDVGTGAGFDAYQLQTSAAPLFGTGVEARRTGQTMTLACTQFHQMMENRGLVRSADVATYQKHPDFAQKQGHMPAANHGRHPLTLYPASDHPQQGPQWGMVIDMNACVACGACVTACQAENNIPVVGKAEVTRGREMHWLRIDHYYEGEPANPTSHLQPVMCMHCESAPCELVCPVEATSHSPDGLNEMTYNRCVGTRYCSNNCPYKVRRFNFFQYADWATASLKMMHNPHVTVRSRGVMEKCTYCVQRIREAEIDANNQRRPPRDGDVVTACQAACPSQAIVFGDIHDQTSRVAKLKADPRNYGLLEELNTRPRTTYLAEVRNPNPRLEGR
ncbi:MAG: TAT-variant-translocated molybdopterin oxidoreductase [Gemmataceae bacterium]|nr:TAT-variant-translocated molybdopterin oxidoreductase [Gemmataceae bacterium]